MEVDGFDQYDFLGSVPNTKGRLKHVSCKIGKTRFRIYPDRAVDCGGLIAILAAIAVPNFLEAQTRAKVARVQADQKSIVTAMETYNIDRKSYPHSGAYDAAQEKTSATRDKFGVLCLTTPVAYINSIPIDPFNPRTKDGQPKLRLYSGNEGNSDTAKKTFYVLMSIGPAANKADTTVFGTDLTQINKFILLKCPTGPTGTHPTSWGIPYDATNGTTSNGGIFMKGGSSAVSRFLCAARNMPIP